MTITDYDLGRDIVAFSTERGQEASANDPYSGLSICNYTGDTALHIEQCRRMLSQRLHIDENHIILPRQTHSANIAIISSAHLLSTEELNGVDALVSGERGVALCINTADCVPVLMADDEARVIAAAHSGWRGTASGIACKTVDAMLSLGARPERIRVLMGPSICSGCFEVSEEVAERFSDIEGCVDRENSKPHIDLGIAIRASLESLGLKRDNIALPSVCSHCNPMRYFSARRLGINSGRTLSVIMMR